MDQVQLKVGVIILAAGDANRLGCSCPKGLYVLDLPKKRTIFEELIGRIKSVSEQALKKYPNQKLAKEAIILYIIISDSHTKEVYEAFEKAANFGYNRVCFIETTQKINCFDENGEILMSSKDQFIKSSYGNGELIE